MRSDGICKKDGMALAARYYDETFLLNYIKKLASLWDEEKERDETVQGRAV